MLGFRTKKTRKVFQKMAFSVNFLHKKIFGFFVKNAFFCMWSENGSTTNPVEKNF